MEKKRKGSVVTLLMLLNGFCYSPFKGCEWVGIQCTLSALEAAVVNDIHCKDWISLPLSRYSRPKLVAGSAEGYTGHVDGRLRESKMNHPKEFTVDDRGNIYVADTMNMAIRKISTQGPKMPGKSSISPSPCQRPTKTQLDHLKKCRRSKKKAFSPHLVLERKHDTNSRPSISSISINGDKVRGQCKKALANQTKTSHRYQRRRHMPSVQETE